MALKEAMQEVEIFLNVLGDLPGDSIAWKLAHERLKSLLDENAEDIVKMWKVAVRLAEDAPRRQDCFCLHEHNLADLAEALGREEI